MVTTIHDDISTRHVAGCVASQKEIGALQLMSLTLSSHWNLVLPDILCLLRYEIADLSGHVTRRHSIRPRKLDPLDGQALAQMDYTSLGRIVCCLQLWDVDHMARHRRCGDERPALETFESTLFLFAPNGSASPCAVKSAVQVRGDDFLVVVNLAIDHGALSPGDSGVGDKDVQPIVEFGDLGSYSLLNFGRVLNIDLVGFAYALRAGSV